MVVIDKRGPSPAASRPPGSKPAASAATRRPPPGAGAGLPPKYQSQDAAGSASFKTQSSSYLQRVSAHRQLLTKGRHDTLQMKTLTRWWASELPKRAGIECSDLSRDLATGVLPVALLEQLTGLEIKHNKEPKKRIQMIEN